MAGKNAFFNNLIQSCRYVVSLIICYLYSINGHTQVGAIN